MVVERLFTEPLVAVWPDEAESCASKADLNGIEVGDDE
jgi:hypothetical protein